MIADKSINLDTLYKVLFDNEKLELSKECIRKVEESFDFLQSFSSDKIIYGINTGFGPMAQYRIEEAQSETLGDCVKILIFAS